MTSFVADGIDATDGRLPTAGAVSEALSAATTTAGRTLTLALHRTMDEVEPLWRSMETTQDCPIHQTYDWCRCWIDANTSRIAVVVGYIDDEPALLLPLEIVRRCGIPVARYVATPFSNVNNGIFNDRANGYFSRPGAPGEFARQLRTLHFDAACVVLDKLPFEWRGRLHPFAGLPHVENQNSAFAITLDGGFDKVLSRHNGRRKRKKFRTSARRLDAAGGWEHVIAATPDEASAMLETFFRQKGERLIANGLPNVFAPETTRNFFRRLARRMGTDRQHPLELHAIRLLGKRKGTLCAVAGLSRKGDHVICQFASLDETVCPDASPGEMLFYLMIGKACDDSAAIFDFGIGEERFKRSWCDLETRHYDVVLPLTPLGHVHAQAYRMATSAKRYIKDNPRALRIANRVRILASKGNADKA